MANFGTIFFDYSFEHKMASFIRMPRPPVPTHRFVKTSSVHLLSMSPIRCVYTSTYP